MLEVQDRGLWRLLHLACKLPSCWVFPWRLLCIVGREREKVISVSLFLQKDTNPVQLPPKGPISKDITVGVRASTYELVGHAVQFITVVGFQLGFAVPLLSCMYCLSKWTQILGALNVGSWPSQHVTYRGGFSLSAAMTSLLLLPVELCSSF